jgi:hypothetical protein
LNVKPAVTWFAPLYFRWHAFEKSAGKREWLRVSIDKVRRGFRGSADFKLADLGLTNSPEFTNNTN